MKGKQSLNMMKYPNRQQFLDAFPDGAQFAGQVVTDSDDPDAYCVADWLAGRSWTQVSYDTLRVIQTSLHCLTPEAMRWFLPAYIFEAMTDLNGEDLDYTVLRFIASDEAALLHLGFTQEQLTLLLDAVDYIRAHCREQFDGLEHSMRNHRKQCTEHM